MRARAERERHQFAFECVSRLRCLRSSNRRHSISRGDVSQGAVRSNILAVVKLLISDFAELFRTRVSISRTSQCHPVNERAFALLLKCTRRFGLTRKVFAVSKRQAQHTVKSDQSEIPSRSAGLDRIAFYTSRVLSRLFPLL